MRPTKCLDQDISSAFNSYCIIQFSVLAVSGDFGFDWQAYLDIALGNVHATHRASSRVLRVSTAALSITTFRILADLPFVVLIMEFIV